MEKYVVVLSKTETVVYRFRCWDLHSSTTYKCICKIVHACTPYTAKPLTRLLLSPSRGMSTIKGLRLEVDCAQDTHSRSHVTIAASSCSSRAKPPEALTWQRKPLLFSIIIAYLTSLMVPIVCQQVTLHMH